MKEYIVQAEHLIDMYGMRAIGELIRCKDCKHQEKYFHADRRRKEGGYNIYWCDLVDGYAPLGFDDEYCAWAERKEE